ncbi:non-structural maintenance of chromosomes element 4 homolog A [Cydia splendana]|uniref:non-structural maintenance of chromosomes element 4 homolog A n=1 Tax=Cydia splendana TaxID=1100963 RepID=UPI0028F47A6B
MSKRKDKSSSGPSPSSSMTTRSRMSVDRKVQYRNFLEGFSKLELEGASMDEKMEYTTNVIKEADELLQQGSMEDRVKNPTESFLASRVLRAASQMAATCAAGVSGAVHVYDRRELAAHIKEKPEFWNVLFPLETPVTCSLFGAVEAAPPEQRPRVERRRAERQALAEKKAPANVDKMDKTEEGAEMVARVKRFVTKTFQRTGAPLSYFHTVLDPGSFARSVENVYHLSFLVREGAVSCHVDEEHGLPFIAPVTEEARGGGLAKEHQFIVSLDMQRWQDLIKAFNIDQPMMVLKR